MASYPTVNGSGKGPEALRDTAFVYDNALAIMALLACGQKDQAVTLGNALVAAADHDRHYKDYRLRNAYRAGPVATPVALPGWWDKQQNRWLEDEYQASTSTGNVAWAGLALLHLYEATKDTRYRETACALLNFISETTRDPGGAPGFRGGESGFEPTPTPVSWKSTEHNIDVMALARWLEQLSGDVRWASVYEDARQFLDQMQVDGKRFAIGTDTQGKRVEGGEQVLDVQIWPFMALPHDMRPESWHKIAMSAPASFRSGNGYDFNDDADGIWLEGTAQVAYAMRLGGRARFASPLFETIGKYRDKQTGFVLASAEPKISTGLTVDAGGTGDAFVYYRLPHLGATAWSILALSDFNPFQPK